MPANVDPLEDFSFEVDWNGTVVAIQRVSPLKWNTAVVDHRAGSAPLNSPQKAPGLTTFEPITLERPIVHGDAAFEQWATDTADAAGGGSGVAFRRTVNIRLLDGQRNPVVVFQLRNCWPSSYEAVTELNADATGMAMERLTLEYEGFTRVDS
jgi:phage tail-like protein